jgi:hypothetical protein
VRLQVEERAGVQLTRAGVGVIDGADAVFVAHQRVELGDVGRQVLDGDGRVLDDLARLGVARDVHHQALAGAAQIPDLVGVVTPEHGEGVAQLRGAQLGLDGLHRGLDLLALFEADFDDEHGAGVADDEEAVLHLLEVGFGALEDVAVDEFAAEGPVPHRDERGVQRVLDGGEMRAHQCARRRQRLDVELELDAEEQRALGAGEELAEVEGFGGGRVEDVALHQPVERVAGVAAGDGGFRVVVADERAVLRVAQQVAHGAVDLRLERGGRAGALGLELGPGQRAEDRLRAVAEEAARRDEVFARGAVDDGVGAAGVVADHAADHRAIGGGSFRREEEAVRLEVEVELVADDTRLDANAALRRVGREHAVQVAPEVHHDAAAHDLAGEGGAGGARDEADAAPVGEGDQLADVRLGFRQGDGDRQLLIFGGVGRVELPHRRIEVQLAREAGGEGGQVGSRG